MSAAITASGAVSVRKIRLPSRTGKSPASRAVSTSIWSKPPSGPTKSQYFPLVHAVSAHHAILFFPRFIGYQFQIYLLHMGKRFF